MTYTPHTKDTPELPGCQAVRGIFSAPRMPATPAIKRLLTRMRELREKVGLSSRDLEQRLMLGPGWVERFESAEEVPSIDVLLAILRTLGASLNSISSELDSMAADADATSSAGIDRVIFAEQAPDSPRDLLIRFRYARHDATYRLPNATMEQFDTVVLEMRNGLARLVATGDDEEQETAVKVAAVANTFLTAMRLWPHANPSDIWTFVVSRLFYDPFNHPAEYSRLDLGQSWKRTSGWALEEIFVRHYGPFLKGHGVNMFIASALEKDDLLESFHVPGRLEADKVDVILSGEIDGRERCFGVCHVKASFAERRTDDQPMSQMLVEAGYCSPLLTMDCKSGPSANPVNRGELGAVLDADGNERRSAKRKDIEVDGYFSACFSYNRNTLPTPENQHAKARVYVCDFNNPEDAFSRFLLTEWERFRAGR